MYLSNHDQFLLNRAHGDGAAMAARILVESAKLLGAERLIDVASAHIDGCLYHGDSGVHFAEALVSGKAQVSVDTTLNVGALDLLNPRNVHLDDHRRDMAFRLMKAHEDMGCRSSWTCAPYQAGHRPAVGQNIAWGESNAVVFANSVLGARTNRYGDFLDICCAITGRAPETGLHLSDNRRAQIVVDITGLSAELLATDAFYPVLGAWYGRTLGEAIGVIDGLPENTSEDRLKALGAAAASSGAVGLFHAVGLTPEAPDLETALAGEKPIETIRITSEMMRAARDRLSTTSSGEVDAIAVGSPHFSLEEFRALVRALAGRRSALPFYACTGRHAIEALEREGLRVPLEASGITLVADTCVVVTPILQGIDGVLMTNSGKFAHYAPGNTGYSVLYGSLIDCVETAVAGRLIRDEKHWQ